jgi:hypothetical protein
VSAQIHARGIGKTKRRGALLKVVKLFKVREKGILWTISKRPAAAAWGNGLWGSVGAAGRSYD